MHAHTGSTTRELGYCAGQARAKPFHHRVCRDDFFLSPRAFVHCLESLPTTEAAGSSSIFPAQRSATPGFLCGELCHTGQDAVLSRRKAENRLRRTHHYELGLLSS